MSMLDPDEPIPVVLRRSRCVNCSLLIPRNQQERSLQQVSKTMITLLQSWVTPTELSSESVLCMECMVLLQDQANSASPLPAFGHRSVCFPCGRSILYASRTYPVRSDRQERNVIIRNVPLHLVSKLKRVCSACWMAAYREVRRQNQHDTMHPTLPDVGTSGDFNIPTPPPLPQHAWQPSQEQNSLKNNDVPKSRSEQAAAESTAAVQYSELNRTEELELDEEEQSRACKPACARKQNRLVKKKIQTLPEIKTRKNTIDQYNCYTIIANVYNYLSREYELLKSQLGGRCDISCLANILKRTAAATGVTQEAVTAALETYKFKTSICSDHSYNRGNTRQEDESDGEGMTPPKRNTSRNIVKSKPSNEEQLPSNTVSGSKIKRQDRIPSYKRSTNNEQNHDSEGEEVRPPKRRSARNNDRITPNYEEQLSYPVSIQSGAPEVMEIEYTAEPTDDESQQTLGNDPLETGSRSPIHCRTPEATEIVFKAEPPDDECPQKPEVDPLETEFSPAALEEPSDASEVEMKVERVDEECADLCTDYSICDPVLLDMKPEIPLE